PLECHSKDGKLPEFPQPSWTVQNWLVMGISARILLPWVSSGPLFGVSPVFPRRSLGKRGAAMANGRITKRVVDGLKPQAKEFAVWDSKLPGFGVRVRSTGAMSYVVVYRAGSGRGAPVRRYTIANVGKATPEAA